MKESKSEKVKDGDLFMSNIESYRDLRTWRESNDLVVIVYCVTSKFPVDERYGLVSQMRRASVSVPSNIAEGMGRGTTKDLMRFLIIARGSVHELRSQLETVKLLSFISPEDFAVLSQRYAGLDAGINAHIQSLLKK